MVSGVWFGRQHRIFINSKLSSELCGINNSDIQRNQPEVPRLQRRRLGSIKTHSQFHVEN